MTSSAAYADINEDDVSSVEAPSAPTGRHADPKSVPDRVDAQTAAVMSASDEIEYVTSAIEELQSRLDRANEQMHQVSAVRTTELEIGRLFVEAQKFTEAALTKLEGQIHEILAEAEKKAAQMVREAHEEAEAIREEAKHQSRFSTEKASELQDAIVGFSSINEKLVEELSTLNTMLGPPPATDEIGAPPSAPRATGTP